MKALSLWQPWASLIASGAKRIETRGWSTEYRGELAIHAAKTFPSDVQDLCFDEPFRRLLVDVMRVVEPARQTISPTPAQFRLPFGAIVAVVRLERVMPTEWIAKQTRGDFRLNDQERAFGNYEPKRFGWLFTQVRALPAPVPCRGMQKIWALEDEVSRQVIEQLVAVDAL